MQAPYGGETPFFGAQRAKHIAEYILEKNQNGIFYPLWGTCMGFWNIIRVLGDNMNVIVPCEDCIYVKRNVYPESTYESKVLRDLDEDLRAKIKEDEINVFLHKDLIAPEVFESNPQLNELFTPVGYSYDAAGKKYVSMAESPLYPIYGAQFHAEKPEFENKPQYNTPHSEDAIRFAQYLAKFFVGEASKNPNVFPDSESYLIDNYSPVSVSISAYEYIYVFPSYGSTRRFKGALSGRLPEAIKAIKAFRISGNS